VIYHEKLEERYISPQFEKHKSLVDSTGVLRHQRGAAWRRLTDIFSPKAG
jgi:predicted rRNA methylase YqxC with S4 and FtsJ domains